MKKFIFTTIFLIIGFSAFFAVRAGINTATPDQTGLVGYWSFNEGNGSIAGDFSGNGNDGTLQNGPTWTDGKMGGALDFDGSSDEHVRSNTSVTIPDNGTLSVWIKGGTDDQVSENIYPFGFYQFSLLGPQSTNDSRSGLIARKDGNNNYWNWGGQNIFDDRWHHYVVSWDDTDLYLYVDGDQIGSPKAINGNLPVGENRDMIAGSSWTVSYGAFTGKLDESRFYNKALSQSEIRDLYEKGLAKVKQPDNTGLVGHWSLDEGNGSVAGDFSENNNDGTLQGNPQWTEGKMGEALDFDGENDRIEPPLDSESDKPERLTVSAWYKTDGNYNDSSLVSDEITTPRDGFSLRANSFRVGKGDNYISANGSLITGEWVHVVGTYDNSIVKFYQNGQKIDEVSLEGPYDKSSRQLVIGYNAWRNTQFDAGYGWVGKLDDVRIYDHVLSESEIQDLYNDTNHTVINASQNDRLTDGLVGMWSFNGPDLDGTTATDVSGNGNDGTLTNGPQPAIGKVGQGLRIDSKDQVVDISNIGNSTITASMWYKYNGVGSNWNTLFCRDGGSYHHLLIESDGSGEIGFYNGSWNGSGYNLTVGNWYHLVLIKDGTNSKLYVNGELKQDSNSSFDNSNYPLSRIGNYGSETQGSLGIIDDVRIYDRALSESEIKRLYKMGR